MIVGAKFDKETDGTLFLPGIFNKQADIESGLPKKKKNQIILVVVYIFFKLITILSAEFHQIRAYKPQNFILLNTNFKASRADYKYQPFIELIDDLP